jgi:hypothetical protein
LKIYQRLISILPFLFVIFFILKHQLEEEKCSGMIDVFLGFFLFLSLLLTGFYAFYAAFRKRQNDSLKFEPLSLAIVLFAIIMLTVGLKWSENFKSKIWLFAEVENGKTLRLTLRQNDHYTASVVYADFGCSYVGKFAISGDTIILRNDIVSRSANDFVEKYVLRNDELIAVKNTIDSTLRPLNLLVKTTTL